MALTLRRWLAIAVLTCAAIAIWLLPPRGQGAVRERYLFSGVYFTGYGFRRQHGWPDASTKIAEAALHLRELQVRDSVFTPAVLAGVTPGLTVLVDRQIADTLRPAIDSAMRRAWAKLDPGAKIPVAVAVVDDTVTTLNGISIARSRGELATVYPPDSTTSVCRVVERLQINPNGRRSPTRIWFTRQDLHEGALANIGGQNLLGACALYATFGKPGPQIATWLAQTAWMATLQADWSHDSPPLGDRWLYWQGLAQPLVDFSGLWTRSWQVRQVLSNDAIACTAGNEARCVTAFLSPVRTTAEDRQWHESAVDVGQYWLGLGILIPSASLGPAASSVVSDMIHDVGRTKFEAFWTSASAPAPAFEAATNEELGSWLQRWAQRQYDSDVLGPWIARRGVVAGLATLVAGLALAMAFGVRRRTV